MSFSSNGYFKKGRLIFVGVLLVIFFGAIVFQYGRLAVTPIERIEQKRPHEIERGSIVDRAGKPLAVQTSFYHVGITPRLITDPDVFANDVAGALDMDERVIVDLILQNKTSSFEYLKRKIPQTMYDEVKSITDSKHYNFVRYDRIPGRIYPENELASQLIGYMGNDGVGLAGIEYSKQNDLSPPPRTDGQPQEQGKNVYLTIDANLQYKLEQICEDALETTQAESMMLVAAEAKTGSIISYISLPTVNLNEYSKATIAQTIDRPAMTAYEPGSAFKIFTIAMAYDLGVINEHDSFFCDGVYEHRTNGETIRITCLDRHGWVTARDALRFSCNDALAQISDRIKEQTFIDKIRAVGFGSRTGIDLPGETTGSVKDPNSRLWSARSKPTIAIGQEISVSALQMVEAATALANGGVPVQLSVISKITNRDGTVAYEHVPNYKERIYKKSTADYVLSCMETTARIGTGSRANLGDISIGVKTGTAQIADTVRGGYSDTDFLSNCIAVFPIEDPEIILYIVIEKARGETYAGRIVAPVIADAADIIIDHFGMRRGSAPSLSHTGRITIPPDTSIRLGSVIPNFVGMSKRELLPLADNNTVRVNISGSGWVVRQSPPPGTPVLENMTIELYLE